MVVDWNSFRESIEDTFYNETISIYEVSQVEDGFGAVLQGEPVLVETKKCNIQNSSRDITKKELGMEIDSRYRVSMSNDFTFDKDKIYVCTLHSDIKNIDSSIQYKIVSNQPFNTYVLLLLAEE